VNSVGSATPALEEDDTPRWRKDLQGIQTIFFRWLNVCLIFVPLGCISHTLEWSSAATFTLNFMAIVPLAAILGDATESLAKLTGEMIGGLVNATLGNAVEMIITVQAIRAGLCHIVQDSLLGSILSNLLLVLGMAFTLGGAVFVEQDFNTSGASANSSILLVASIGVALPSLYSQLPEATESYVLSVSRICALILAGVYVLFLLFQLKTHKFAFSDDPADDPRISISSDLDQAARFRKKQRSATWAELSSSVDLSVVSPGSDCQVDDPPPGPLEDAEEEDGVDLSVYTAVGVLCGVTLVISYLSEFLVDSIELVSTDFGIPKTFIGLILLPIVGNAAEHLTAVQAAYRGKMDLALGVAVGSSTQVSLFVFPFAVIVGWIYDKPLTLSFRGFDLAVLMLSVFLVSSVLQDGSSNWLEGVMLLATYSMVAVICCYIEDAG